jgi:hypothetical protein
LYFFAFGVGIDSHFANTPTIDLFDQRPDDFVFAAGHAGSSWFDPIAGDQHHVGVFRIDSNEAFGEPIGEISKPLALISCLARVESNDSMTFALLVRIPSKKAPTISSGLVGLVKFSDFSGIISSWGAGLLALATGCPLPLEVVGAANGAAPFSCAT